MPMIEFRYMRDKISDEDAFVIGRKLEDLLRDAVAQIRPNNRNYGVTVEGDPFRPIAFNQPSLRVYVFYHQEWNFTADELKRLADALAANVEQTLRGVGLIELETKIRFYARAGHASATILW